MRVTPVPAGARVVVEFSDDLELLVHVLRADLHDVEWLDVSIESEGQASGDQRHLPAMPFDATRGEVLVACQRHYVTSTPHMVTTFRLYAVRHDDRRAIGEYVVDHLTPT